MCNKISNKEIIINTSHLFFIYILNFLLITKILYIYQTKFLQQPQYLTDITFYHFTLLL